MSQYLAQITNPYLSDTFQGMYGFDFVNRIVPSLIVFGLVVGIIIFVFMLISGGVQWIASSGNKVALEDARRKIVHALIGLFILLSLWAFIGLINLIFGINIGNLDIIDREPTPGPVTIDCEVGSSSSCTCDCDEGWSVVDGLDCVDDYPTCPGQCTCEYTPHDLSTPTPISLDGNCIDYYHSVYGDMCLCDCPTGSVEETPDSCNSIYGYPACVGETCSCVPSESVQDLLLHYELNEGGGTTVNDSSGNGYDAGVVMTDDIFAYHYGCGGGSFFSDPGDGGIAPGSQTAGDDFWYDSFSYSAWFDMLHSIGNPGDPRRYFLLGSNPTGLRPTYAADHYNVEGVIESLDPSIDPCTAGTGDYVEVTVRSRDLAYSEAYYLTFVYDAFNRVASIYVNGQLDSSVASNPPARLCPTDTPDGVRLMQNYEPFGYIDDARIYNYALSQTEISDLYNSCNWQYGNSYVRNINLNSEGGVNWPDCLPSDPGYPDDCTVGFDPTGYLVSELQFDTYDWCVNMQGRAAYTMPPYDTYSGEHVIQVTCDNQLYDAATPLGTDGLPNWSITTDDVTGRIYPSVWGSPVSVEVVPDCSESNPLQARASTFVESAGTNGILYLFYTCQGRTNVHPFPRRTDTGRPDWGNGLAWEYIPQLSYTSAPHCSDASSVQAMSAHVLGSFPDAQLNVNLTCDGITRTALINFDSTGNPNWSTRFWHPNVYESQGKIFPDGNECLEVLGRNDTVFTTAGVNGQFQQALTCRTQDP